MTRYDTIIVGTGPAGLEAALNLKIRRKSFLIFGSAGLSRKLEAAPRIDNYLGFPAISGQELAERMSGHLTQMEIEVTPEKASMIYHMGGYFTVAAGNAIYEASSVILATGVFSAEYFPGEEEFLGRGVGYCATCDAPLYKGKTVAVAGYTENAASEADFVAEIAKKVYYIPMGDSAAMPKSPVETLRSEITAIRGEIKVSELELSDRTLHVDGVFILRDSIAPASLLPGLEVENGFIKTDANMKTNIPGCFAAGDCTGRPHQYMRAAGQGLIAAHSATAYLAQL